MPAGRPKKPTALKVVQGTTRPDRANPAEPKPARVKPRMPAHMPRKAKIAWRELCELLDGMGVLTLADRKALEQLCHAYCEWRDLVKLVEKDGYTYWAPGPNGEEILKSNPAVAMASDAQKRIRAMLVEFGLTPSARTRVKVEEKKPTDPLAEFLARKKR